MEHFGGDIFTGIKKLLIRSLTNGNSSDRQAPDAIVFAAGAGDVVI